MRKILLLSVLVLLYANSFAQVTFEPGYFIDNTGKRVECLIRNPDRIANPVKFEYKESENAPVKTAEIESVSAFEIINTVHKYERHKVLLERSGANINKLLTLNEIEFKEEEVFLRLLVEGKATLYAFYTTEGIGKFFYKTDAAAIKPLISYIYQNDQGELKENNSFRQELLTNLKSDAVSLATVSNLRYKERELHGFFIKYNRSVGAVYTDNATKNKKGAFHLAVKAGINNAGLDMRQTVRNSVFTGKMNPKISPVVGLEFEYVFPINKNKWSAYFEPTFQYYKTEADFVIYFDGGSAPSSPGSTGGRNTEGTINYTHISLPVGIKHAFFLNKTSALVLNGALVYNLVVNTDKVFDIQNIDPADYPPFEQMKMMPLPGYCFGVSYLFKNSFSIKTESQLNKIMLSNTTWQSKFTNSFSILLGYRLF